jgi:hypothetical protein
MTERPTSPDAAVASDNSAMYYISQSDSSSVMMRATAAALAGTWADLGTWPAHIVALSGPANRLPLKVRATLLDRSVRDLGVSPDLASEVNTEDMARWATALYEQSPAESDRPPSGSGQDYGAIVIGAPSGGVAHLAALLEVPFLSEHFLTGYRYRGAADNIAAYHSYGSQLAATILQRNPDLAVINHYDPLHDRAIIPYVNYLRMKLLELPSAYADFIRCHLRPGGTLLFVDCHYGWRQYRVGKRHYFQVGGLGGVRDEDYVKGSTEVQTFLAQQKSLDLSGWSLPYPWLAEPESEWGSLPAFRQAVEGFADQHGYRFRTLRGPHPEDFARVAFYASYQAALNAGREPEGVLVDCFTHCSPTAALAAGLLPLWLPYTCQHSLEFLRAMAQHFPKGKPILLSLAPAYSPVWDLARIEDWPAACGADPQIHWIGTDPNAYPVDLAARFRFIPELQSWCAGHQTYPRPPFTIDDLEALISGMAAVGTTAG